MVELLNKAQFMLIRLKSSNRIPISIDHYQKLPALKFLIWIGLKASYHKRALPTLLLKI